MSTCSSCGKVLEKEFKCRFCGRVFCEECFFKHMAYERRHEAISRATSDVWKLRKKKS